MPERFAKERGCSDVLFLVNPKWHRRWLVRRPTQKAKTKNMEIKIKGLVRRQMVYGFVAEKDAEGEIVGSSVVKLARRNAFELVGLKRPAFAPAWRWNTN
jgi:hypothetical protein